MDLLRKAGDMGESSGNMGMCQNAYGIQESLANLGKRVICRVTQSSRESLPNLGNIGKCHGHEEVW